MSITEFPKLGEPRIAPGTFVLFSFDPAAYASVIDSEDALLSEDASQIKRKKYLGLVVGVGPIDLPKLRQNLDIRVIGLAPPQEGEDDVYPTGPNRCIPVAPAAVHPDGREPLTPSVPLPWPESYLHTLQLINAFVSRVYHSNPTGATISKEELRRVSKCVVQDRVAAAAERRALKPVKIRADDKQEEYETDEEYESGSDSSFDEIEVPAIPSKAYMEIWEDLAAATSLGEPKDVGEDFDEVMLLGINWQQRKKRELRTNASGMSNWAARVAESAFECSEGDLDEAARSDIQYVQGDCDELTPEDAIDERVQPGKLSSVDHVDANGAQTHLEVHPAMEPVDTKGATVPDRPIVQATDLEFSTTDDQKEAGGLSWLESLVDWLRGLLRR